MWVKLGVYSRSDQDIEEILVSDKIVHEKYRKGHYHDIALLKIPRKVTGAGKPINNYITVKYLKAQYV